MISAEYLDYANLPPGSLIDVETKSRHYRIECHGGSSITISGHPEYCPEPVPARLQGAIDPEGVLEYGLIGKGKRLRFLLGGQLPITTTRVIRLRVERSQNAPSVH
jgi:hypothetical protein